MSCKITKNPLIDVLSNYNTPTYTDYEMNQYTYFMEYCEAEVNKSNLPKHIKKRMMEKRNLHKRNNNNTWYLEEEGYEVEFLPFKSWLLQTEREQKLNELGI